MFSAESGDIRAIMDEKIHSAAPERNRIAILLAEFLNESTGNERGQLSRFETGIKRGQSC
jgi:hypothetical protein